MNPLLLPGEFHYFPKEIDNICILDRDKIISENGKVWITNFRIIFRFSVSQIVFFYILQILIHCHQ